MYHHVKLHKDATQYCGFSVVDESGVRRYYEYLVLAFGLSPAVYITDKLTRPIKAFCIKMAICINLYIDDGLLIGFSYKFCKASYNFNVFILMLSGWTIQEAKCISTPTKRILYLGYYLDSELMRISVDESKCQRVVDMVDNVKKHFSERRKISCKAVASLCGLLAHLFNSHGQFIAVVSRNCNHSLGKEVCRSGWESQLWVTIDMITELDLCVQNIFCLNGQPLIREQEVVSVIKPTQVKFMLEGLDPLDKNREKQIFVSDSSESKAFWFKAGDCRLVDEYLFDQTQKDLSSGFRELISVSKAFEVYSSYFSSLRGSMIIWLTDSTSLVSFLEKGSRIPAIQQEVIKIKKKEYAFGLKLKAKWISRDDEILRLADAGSKLHLCSDQYGISTEDFIMIQEAAEKKFSIDGFASAVSRKTEKFISACPQLGACDTDFFSCTMDSSEYYYLHPPPKLLFRLVSKISCYKNVRGAILLPVWRSHSFWVAFVQQKYFVWFVKKFIFFSPTYVAYSPNTIFQGKKDFLSLVIFFDTSGYFRLECPPI